MPHDARALGDDAEQRAVGLAAVILAPCHLASIAAQVDPADAVMLAEFGAAQAEEEAICPIGAGLIRAVSQRVVDHLARELGAQLVPTDPFVRVDGATLPNARLDEVHRSSFRLKHGDQGASVALMDGNHDFAFAGSPVWFSATVKGR